MEIHKGIIEKIIFSNDDNNYSVIVLSSEEDEFVCAGYLVDVEVGEYLEVTGEWKNHPNYGPQFSISSYRVVPPSDAESALRYLSSGIINGVGPKTAQRIVEAFGDETFEILDKNPERLASLKGISKKQALHIGEQVREKVDLRAAIVFLSGYNITNKLALKIYKSYGSEMYAILKTNPYRMADEIDGIGFKIADDIAIKTGINLDSEYRIESGIVYELGRLSEEGHTCYPLADLKIETENLLGFEIDASSWDTYIMNLIVSRRLVILENDKIKYAYLPWYNIAERTVANLIVNFLNDEDEEIISCFKNIDKFLDKGDVVLDDIQKDVVRTCVFKKLTIITGGPGTGKTTVINTALDYFERNRLKVVLTAPTGRAAKRMTEATGRDALTIHRLLEMGLNEEQSKLMAGRNEDNPIEADIIIVDEMSMVDIGLMHMLLRAISSKSKLILVGDPDQLPSVGAGNVLKDLIDALPENVVKLTKIYRQSEDSSIATIAHKINNGEDIDLGVKLKDFFLVERNGAGIRPALKTLILDKLPKYFNAKPMEIQVLSPIRNGECGVKELNTFLQDLINPSSNKKREILFGDIVFREGDKVMHIKNDYRLEWEVYSDRGRYVADEGVGIFNGDVGIIQEINTFAKTVEVLMDYDTDAPKTVVYEYDKLEELTLAYAITIHKSQGSEYDNIIMVLPPAMGKISNRNLLYTGITRAKKNVCLIGTRYTFNQMMENIMVAKRYSNLVAYIQKNILKNA